MLSIRERSMAVSIKLGQAPIVVVGIVVLIVYL